MSKTAMNLFGQTYEEISKVFGGSDTKFQLAYPFIDWTWPTPKSGFIDPTAYTYVSRIPQWSAIGESYRPTATDLHSVYRSMLLEAPRLTISPEKQQRLKDADEYITKCQNKKLENERAAYRAWHLATANLPPGVPTPNFKEWMVTSGWNKVIQSDKAALDKATKTKELIVAQQNPQYVEVLNAATPPNVGDIKLKSGYVHCFVAPGQEEVLPNYLIGKSGSDWVAELTRGGGMSVDIQLSNSKSSSALQESWAEGVVTADYKFFSVYSENEWKELDIASEEKSLKVNINIAAVTQVPIAPDSGWYNSGYLKLLQEKGEWNSPFTNDKVFGKDGMIPLVVTGMIAGYKPSFEITMSEEAFQMYKSQFTTSNGIRIGPFQFGGGLGGGVSSDKYTSYVGSNTFSGKSEAEYPFIMGFTVSEAV